MLKKLKNKTKKLKKQLSVLMIAYKDTRTPLLPKILIGITIGYLLSPIDLIPDFIPVLGLLDDLLIVPLLITISIKLIPGTIIIDAKAYAETHPEMVKKSNWVFAIAIIIVWMVLIALFVKKLKFKN